MQTPARPNKKLSPKNTATNPVIPVIQQALTLVEKGQLKSLAKIIDYGYNNLWSVYHETRNMPIMPLSRLCKLVGMTDAQAIQLFDAQPTPRNKPDKLTE